MRKNPTSQSGTFNPRLLVAVVLCSSGAFLAMLSFASAPSAQTTSSVQGNWTQLGSYAPPVKRNGYVLTYDAATTGSCVTDPAGINACPSWVSIYDNPNGHGNPGTSSGLDAATHITVSPLGDRLYVTGESHDNTTNSVDIATVAYDTASGQQVWVARYNGPLSLGDFPNGIAVSPDGSRVFVVGTQNNNRITSGDFVTLAYNAATGQQLWTMSYSAPNVPEAQQSSWAQGVVVSPDGSRVTVTGLTDFRDSTGDLVTIAYDAGTGQVLWTQRYRNGPQSAGLAIGESPSGGSTYITGYNTSNDGSQSSLTIAYEASTGAQLWIAGYAGPAGSSFSTSLLTVSPDGSQLYVAGSEFQTQEIGFIGVVTRQNITVAYDAATGRQLWAATYSGSAQSLDDSPLALEPSHDGKRVFITGISTSTPGVDDAFTVAYDRSSGAQLWASRYNFPGYNDNIGRSLAESSDGTTVYMAGSSATLSTSDYLTVAYDETSGSQRWARRYNNMAGAGVDAVSGSAIAPDGSALFITGKFGYIDAAVTGDVGDFGTVRYDLGVPLLTSVVSRKVHGSAGTFDIDLPLAGARGVECRGSGSTNDYTLVFTFANNLITVGGASASGCGGSVSSSGNGPNSNQYTVNLTGVSNACYITVTLTDVLDSAGNFSSAVSASMGVLLGDVDASGRVDAADVSLVRQQTLQPVTTSNFREDVNTSGRIDAADASITRQQTLTSLP
jgi:hypothetical protein